jgi:hypothetical protein
MQEAAGSYLRHPRVCKQAAFSAACVIADVGGAW